MWKISIVLLLFLTGAAIEIVGIVLILLHCVKVEEERKRQRNASIKLYMQERSARSDSWREPTSIQ
jgi:hypothetical protein